MAENICTISCSDTLICNAARTCFSSVIDILPFLLVSNKSNACLSSVYDVYK